MPRTARLALALGALTLTLQTARATIVVDESYTDLARASTLVVRGTVVAQKVQWDEAHRLIVTRTFLEPTRVFKGSAGKTVVVRQVGGVIGDLHLAVQGTAKFKIGEDVVVFLQPHPVAVGDDVLSAMAAAKLTVIQTKRGPMVKRSLSGLTLARADAKGVVRPSALPPSTPDELSYAAFVAQVMAGAN